MKKAICCLLLLLFAFACVASAVYVNGYFRSDGTYVRPHCRSNPDSFKWNNYGSSSYSQKQEWADYSTLPSYMNDYDDDGLWNQHDYDDDNDGLFDDYDSDPYDSSDSSYDDW